MSEKQKIHQHNKRKSHLIILLFCAVIIVALGAYLFVQQDKKQTLSTPDTTSSEAPPQSVNLSPPTEEEIQETDEFKKDLGEQKNTENESQSTSGNITPVIVSTTDNEVRAYIPGIFEEGGVCTATLTKGTDTREFTSNGFGNVSNTNCEPILLSGLETGSWGLKVSYKSTESYGVSTSTTLEIK